MVKPLDPKIVQPYPAGHLWAEWPIRMPAGIAYADLFRCDTWAKIESQLRPRVTGKKPAKDDTLRIVAADGSFDVTCTIIAISDGYVLQYRHGRRPSPVVQVLDDLAALPDTGSGDLKEQAKTLRKRWAAAGVTRDDIASARRTFAKSSHPDTNPVDGQRLAAANAVLDAALAIMQEAA